MAVACQYFTVSFPSISESLRSGSVSKAEVLLNIEGILGANHSAHSNGDAIAVFGIIQDVTHNAAISSSETTAMMHGGIASVSQTQSKFSVISAINDYAELIDQDMVGKLSVYSIMGLLQRANALLDEQENVTALNGTGLDCIGNLAASLSTSRDGAITNMSVTSELAGHLVDYAGKLASLSL